MTNRLRRIVVAGAIFGCLSLRPDFFAAEIRPAGLDARSGWARGPSTNENFFPIGVWLQDPKNAPRFKAAGINVYVALWRGPTTNQLAQLHEAGMSVICSQNRAALENKDSPVIVG